VIEAKPRPQLSGLEYHGVLQETKKQLILKAIAEANGSYGEAARLLAVHVNYLHRLIRDLDLKPAVKESR
jgi:DNA-binding NtrC family response regulator